MQRKWLAVRTDVHDVFLEESREAVKFYIMRDLPVDIYELRISPADGSPSLSAKKMGTEDLETL